MSNNGEGLTLPREPIRKAAAARSAREKLILPGSFKQDVMNQQSSESRARQRLDGRTGSTKFDEQSQRNMEGMGKRTGAAMGTDAQWAWPKLHDPFEYWRERTWWFNMEDPDEQIQKIRDWTRLMYTTHYLVPSLIDIYTRFPLLDIEFTHQDPKIAEFYTELFFDGLNYEEFLFDLGREHWTVGEAFAMGSWHDGIGAWEDDEIINPNDVIVAKNRALRTYQYHIKVPDEIKKLIDTRDPAPEYAALMQLYPDVVAWARQDKEIPVSDVLMKQLKFKTNPWSEHGSPILLRAFRMLMLEESLNSAQDAIADRLYSPLILATLGLPDVDEDGPWIPDATELQQLRDDLALAINSDFRLMTYHHGLDIKNAFGREAMPRLDQDFLRVESKVMQVFGIGAELLQGGNSNAPYASGALNRELITNMLTTYQKKIKRFIQERMRPVAERQGHYEYRKVGNARIPVMETVLLVNEETGEEYVEERPKLAIPDVQFKSMNLRDEQVERQFIMELSGQGFPVSLKTMAVNIPIDFKDEIEAKTEEKLQTVVAEQRFKKELFERLIALELPIPPEYYQEFMAYNMQQENPEMIAQMAPQGIADITSQPSAPNILTPGTQADADSMVGPFLMPGMIPPQRSAESDNQKKTQPKKPSTKKTDDKKTKKSSINGSEYEHDDGYDDDDFDFDIYDNPVKCSACDWVGDYDDLDKASIVSKTLKNPCPNCGEKNSIDFKTASVKYASNNDGYVAEYGGRMYFGVPKEQVLRRKMTLVKGMKIVTDDQYQKFNLEDFEENYRVATAVGDNPIANEAGSGVSDDATAYPDITGAGLDFQNDEGKK